MVKSESNGRTYYVDEVDEEKRPFKALLDVGIRSTSTGCVYYRKIVFCLSFYLSYVCRFFLNLYIACVA